MGTTSSALFSGNSRFASDFSTLIDRQVALASLPLATLQNTKSRLSDQSTELSSVDSRVASLQSSLTSLESALGTGSFTASAFNKAGATPPHDVAWQRSGRRVVHSRGYEFRFVRQLHEHHGVGRPRPGEREHQFFRQLYTQRRQCELHAPTRGPRAEWPGCSDQ